MMNTTELVESNFSDRVEQRKIVVIPSELTSTIIPPLQIDDDRSQKGQFGWGLLAKEHLPYIFRGIDKYYSVRMVDATVIIKYLKFLHQDIFLKCLAIKSTYISHYEAKLFNEINYAHCDGKFGVEQFTGMDLVISSDDAERLCEFLEFCLKKLTEKNYHEICGFIKINNDSSVPFVIKNGARCVPLFYFEGEMDNFRSKVFKLTGWDLSYLKFLCRIQNIQNDLFSHDSCSVIDVEDIIGHFPPNTTFSEDWLDLAKELLVDGDLNNKINGFWFQIPTTPPLFNGGYVQKINTVQINNGLKDKQQFNKQLNNQPYQFQNQFHQNQSHQFQNQSPQFQNQSPQFQNQSHQSDNQPNQFHNRPNQVHNPLQNQPNQFHNHPNQSHNHPNQFDNQPSQFDNQPNQFHNQSYQFHNQPSQFHNHPNRPIQPKQTNPFNDNQPIKKNNGIQRVIAHRFIVKSTEVNRVINGNTIILPNSHVQGSSLMNQTPSPSEPVRFLIPIPDPVGGDTSLAYKFQRVVIDGKALPCINMKAYSYNDMLMVCIIDLNEYLFRNVPFSVCSSVIQTLNVPLYKANDHQVRVFISNNRYRYCNSILPLIHVKDVIRYLPQMKYMLASNGDSSLQQMVRVNNQSV